MNKLGIDVDENIKTIVSGVIENKVYDLKTPEEKKSAQQTAVQSQVSQLQTQNSQLQSEKTQLQVENAQLKQTIASIQSTVTPVQNTAAPTNTNNPTATVQPA